MGFRKFFETLFGLNTPSPPPATEMQRWQNVLLAGSRLRRQEQFSEALEVFEGVLAEVRQAHNPVAEATVLGHIGAVYTDLKEWESADQILQQAVSIARAEENPVLLSAVLNDWGSYLLAKGDGQAAQAAFEEAVTNARQGADPQLTAHILVQLADLYMAQQNAAYARRLLEEANQLTRYQVPAYVGRFGEANIATGNEADGHRWIVQALRLSHALGNVDQEIIWAVTLAGRYREDGKLHEANRLYERVALLLGRGVTVSKEARAVYLVDRADTSYQLGQYEKAVGFAEECIPLAEDLGKMDIVARAHGLVGAAYRAQGQRDAAIVHLQTALSYLSQEAAPIEAITLRLELARVLQDVDLNAAAETYHQVITDARAADETTQLARALTYLGRLEHQRGNMDLALQHWREAMRIFEDLGDHRHLSPVLCDMANLLKDKGDRKQALSLYEQALVSLNNVQHPQTRGLVLSNVANMYTDTGDIETAQAFYEEAVAIARDTGDRAAESLRLGNLGWFYIVTGRFQKAVTTLNAAMAISNQLGITLMQAVQRDNLAMAYARLEDYDRAISLHKEALQLIQGQGHTRWEGVFYSNMGETLARQGKLEEAHTCYEKSLELSRSASDEMTMVRTLWRFGDLQRLMGNLSAAEANYQKAVHNAQLLGTQRDLAYAFLGQGLLALLQHRVEQAGKLLQEAKRLLTILHAPEQQQAESALRQVV